MVAAVVLVVVVLLLLLLVLVLEAGGTVHDHWLSQCTQTACPPPSLL